METRLAAFPDMCSFYSGDTQVERGRLKNEIPFSDDWENNLIMLRYDAKVLVHEND